MYAPSALPQQGFSVCKTIMGVLSVGLGDLAMKQKAALADVRRLCRLADRAMYFAGVTCRPNKSCHMLLGMR